MNIEELRAAEQIQQCKIAELEKKLEIAVEAHERTVQIIGDIIDRFTPEAIARPSQNAGNLAMIELMHCFKRSRQVLEQIKGE